MKTRAVCIIAAFMVSLAMAYGQAAKTAKTTQAPTTTQKIVVMNPRGIQPEIRKIPMGKRPATLDEKTVYIVDTKYPNTKPFVESLHAALKAKYPKTTWILRDKVAGYMDDDPALWKEIKEKGSAAIVLLGH